MKQSHDGSELSAVPEVVLTSTRQVLPESQQQVLPTNEVAPWLARAIVNMKRMHSDEAYRLEIAKKLS